MPLVKFDAYASEVCAIERALPVTASPDQVNFALNTPLQHLQ